MYSMEVVIIPHPFSPIPLLHVGEGEGGVVIFRLISILDWGMGLRFISNKFCTFINQAVLMT